MPRHLARHASLRLTVATRAAPGYASGPMRTPSSIGSVVLSVLLTACSPSASAAPKAPAPATAAVEKPIIDGDLKEDADIERALRESYTKYEHRIAMRDGVKLHTAVYVPKDTSRTYPIMLNRTPYTVGVYGEDALPTGKDRFIRRIAPSPAFVKQGYILVHQDVRGKMMSEGTFVDVRPMLGPTRGKTDIDETTDAYDTIAWLVKNVPANNGKVGAWGISYPGFYAAQTAASAHPALKAVSPQAPVTEWFIGDDFHHHGAFFLGDAFGFYSSFGKARKELTKKMDWGFDYKEGDLYTFFLNAGPIANLGPKYMKDDSGFWNDLMTHGTRDAFWKARDPRPHYKGIKAAVLTVGGLYDAEDLWGTVETYRAIENQNPGIENTLVLGPWGHGGWARGDGDKLGDISFGQKTAIKYQNDIEFPFFERHLRGVSTPKQKEAIVFETGTNQWQSFDVWPPKEAKPQRLSFGASGTLSTTPAAADEKAFDAFVSDPARPVPYHPASSLSIERDYMIIDQRFAAQRPDVLVYQTEPLESSVTVGGPVDADLWVSTTSTDADWVVKLIDVYPHDAAAPDPNPKGIHMGGYQRLVRAEVMRGKFRESYETPSPFKPGEPTQVKVRLPDVLHTFRAGHRIMVQVQSSWFPLVDRNPQTFVDIYAAKASDFVSATHRVFRAGDKASGVIVPVLRGALPEKKP